MILHGILAYRSSITCYVSIITILLQHFTILLILHLLIYALSHTIPILHSPTVLAKWANSPSPVYNTRWTILYCLLDTSWFSIINIALQQTPFHTQPFYLHILYSSPSLLFTFRPSLHFGLLAQAPSIIQYGQSIFRFGTRVGSPSPTSLSPIRTTPYPLLLFSSNHSDSNQNDYISLFPAYFHSFGMILHWILAYRFQSLVTLSVITILLQHFAIPFSNHLFTSTPSHTITIFHSPTVLKIWAISPSTIYNTVWTISRYLLDTSWFSIINIALQQPLFHRFCTHSCLFHPLPSLPFILRPSSHFGLLAPAPLIILSYQSYTTSWTSVGDSSPTSCSNTSLFYSLFFYLHILYPSLSLLSTFRQSLHFGLSARAPLIIRYG